MGATGPASGGTNGGGIALNSGAASSHTHIITTSLSTGNNNLPAYVDVQIAKYTVTPPSVTTDSATSVAVTSATLNSTVNPNSLSTDVFYKYDTSNVACASMSTTTASTNIGSGSTNVTPNARSITSLTPGISYYYCAGATNSDGTTYGSSATFTTPNTVQRLIRGGVKYRGGSRL